MQNWGSNIISYTSIGYNDGRVGIRRHIDSDVVKIAKVILDILSSRVEGKTIWERVDESLSQRKLFIKRRKSREEFVTLIVTLIVYIN